MTRHFPISAALSALVLATACATTPEPCTPEWVDYETGRIMSDFARHNRSEVNDLRDFAAALEDGNTSPLIMMRIPAHIETLKTLAAAFEVETLPDLNAAISQCSDPQLLIPAFTSFLRDEGVGEDVLEWVEVLAPLALENRA